jgi:hypothetical protein
LARTQCCVDLRRLALEQVVRGLLQPALVGEVGRIGGVLADGARLTSHFAQVARGRGLVLSLAERLKVFRAARQCIC